MGDTWSALADPTRRAILHLLRHQNRTAGDIAGHFAMTKPSISHHLGILRQAGLVTAQKKGQQVEYALNTTVFQEILGFIAQLTEGEKEA